MLKPHCSQAIAQQTTTRAGRIRVVQVERYDQRTGRSERLTALQLCCKGSELAAAAREVVRLVTAQPGLYWPQQTDAGLRFEHRNDAERVSWFVYSY